MKSIKLIECPRDAMQGLSEWIPTETKVQYLNQLLKVGFDTLDFGSFVSPKAIPQLRDTTEVLANLDLSTTKTKLLAIVANVRGAQEAASHAEISYIGFPFSISETFQQRNTNSSIADSMQNLAAIQDICLQNNKTLVVYISMAFGNPYGDEYHPDIAAHWSQKLSEDLGVKVIALSDTIGSANTQSITDLFTTVIPALPNVEIGAHLHSTPMDVALKLEAAIQAGCNRFDGAIKGFGGCPMASDSLTGNMNTELMVQWLTTNNTSLGLNLDAFTDAVLLAEQVFPHH